MNQISPKVNWEIIINYINHLNDKPHKILNVPLSRGMPLEKALKKLENYHQAVQDDWNGSTSA